MADSTTQPRARIGRIAVASLTGTTIEWWWNLVGRTDEEIREAREAWSTTGRFGDVEGCDGARLPAPRCR
ncbi:hypothetical protein ACH4MA_25070 [Streptomyces roseolus]|uniref:hypothetical protein n=1 Tax=Streptomyces roseolus TaxID=67358 RepID=UPI0037A2CE6E